jgi:hypothetical protein
MTNAYLHQRFKHSANVRPIVANVVLAQDGRYRISLGREP